MASYDTERNITLPAAVSSAIAEMYCHNVPIAQGGIECMAISLSACLAFLGVAKDAVENVIPSGPGRRAKIEQMDIDNLSTYDDFFVDAIKTGSEMFNIVAEMRQYTDYNSMESLAKLQLLKIQYPGMSEQDIIKRMSTTTSDNGLVPEYTMELYNAVAEELDQIMMVDADATNDDVEKDVLTKASDAFASFIASDCHIDETVLDTYASIPGFIHVPKNTMTHMDELFSNLPGLCFLNRSEIVLYTQLSISTPSIRDIIYQRERLMNWWSAQMRSSNGGYSFLNVATPRSVLDFVSSLDKYRWDESNIELRHDLATAIYYARTSVVPPSAHECIHFSPPEKLPKKIPWSILDSEHIYDLAEFVESIMFRKMSPQVENWSSETLCNIISVERDQDYWSSIRHMRAFVLTSGASSYSFLCNTETTHSLIFNSHPSGGFSSNSCVYLFRNRYALYRWMLTWFSPSAGCFQQNSCRSVEVIEIVLRSTDHDLIAKYCEPYKHLRNIVELT